MRHLDTRLTQRTLEPEVEVGRINANEDLRAPLQQSVAQLSSHRAKPRIFANDLGVATHGQRLAVPPGIEALSDHRRPANPLGLQQRRIAEFMSKTPEHRCSKQIAGGLAGNHPEAECSGLARSHDQGALCARSAISGRCRG